MKIKTQLLSGFAAVIAVFVLSMAVVGVFLNGLVDHITLVKEQSLPLVVAVDSMDLNRSEVQQFLTDVSATHDPAGYGDAAAAAKAFLAGVEQFKSHFQRTQNQPGLAQIEAIAADFNRFNEMGKLMAETYVAQGMEAGNERMKGSDNVQGFDQASESLSTKLEAFRKGQLAQADEAVASAVKSARHIVTVLLVGCVAASLLALVLGSGLAGRILRQLGGEPTEALALARKVGSGDLNHVATVRAGDTKSVMANLVAMQNSLARSVRQVRNGAGSLAVAAEHISTGNRELAERTASQAGSLEEAGASMAQLSAAVGNNSKSGNEANQLARTASEVAQRGGVVMGEMVETMTSINDASQKIADIIGVIDGIAFQTNILALNAAVEAARAGEQGRGFAVVAGEVRLLAGRSAEAAKEIKTLISASVTQVAQGSLLVNQAGATMNEVVTSIQRVTHIMDEISSASHQQASGVAEVGLTVTQLDAVNQQNAALVDAMDKAGSNLSAQARDLVQAVSVFKLPA